MTPIPAKYRDMLIDEIERAVDRERPVDFGDDDDSAYFTSMSLISLRRCIADAIRAWERQVHNLETKG